MKVSEAQLRKIIIVELQGVDADTFNPPAEEATLATKAEAAEELVRKNAKKIRKYVRKLLKGGRQARKIINNPEARALIGAAMKHGKTLNTSLGRIDKAFKIVDKVRYYSGMIKDGRISIPMAKKLLQAAYPGAALKLVFGIIGAGILGAGGLVAVLAGGIVSMISKPLIQAFDNDINDMHRDLVAAYEATNWVRVAAEEKELESTLYSKDISKELKTATKDLEAPGTSSITLTPAQALAQRDPDFKRTIAGKAEKLEAEPIKLSLPRGAVSIRSGATKPFAVMQIQRALSEIGVWQDSVDGEFSEELRQTIKSFQKSENLYADGIYGPKTRGAIQKKLQIKGMDIRLSEYSMSREMLKTIIHNKYQARMRLEA